MTGLIITVYLIGWFLFCCAMAAVSDEDCKKQNIPNLSIEEIAVLSFFWPFGFLIFFYRGIRRLLGRMASDGDWERRI
jgi:hypothetical protein